MAKKASQPVDQNDQVKTVTIGAVTYRARKPEEWSVTENNEAMKYGFASQSLFVRAKGDESESTLSIVIMDYAAKLVEEDRYRRILTLGLWPDGVEYNSEEVALHEATIAEARIGAQNAMTALVVAIVGFTTS